MEKENENTMSSYRKLSSRLTQLLGLFSRNEDWLILVNADPDAMAAALALKRIMSHRTGKVLITRINDISRPDNLAMIRYLRIPLVPWSVGLKPFFHRFALVDSQPHHNPVFQDIPFSIVIDHHPVVPEHPVQAVYTDIRPQYGSTSTLFTEYLRGLHIRPGIRLATALQYGIRTDTANFTRKCTELDMRAYQFLAKHADTALLIRINRSEYLPEWLTYFTRAFTSMHECGKGTYAFLGSVENPDILVVIADFFTRVHGLRWVGICGVYKEQVVVIFRGDGLTVDLGAFASARLGALGFAGGHRALARAEFPLAAAEGRNIEVFVYRKLQAAGEGRAVASVAPAVPVVPSRPEGGVS
ncbi:MAG: phosphoesterase [Bilophila sp.]